MTPAQVARIRINDVVLHQNRRRTVDRIGTDTFDLCGLVKPVLQATCELPDDPAIRRWMRAHYTPGMGAYGLARAATQYFHCPARMADDTDPIHRWADEVTKGIRPVK